MRVREKFQRTIGFDKTTPWLRVLLAFTTWTAASSSSSAQPARRVAVLALETDAARDDVVARRLTQELRAVVAERPVLQVHETRVSLSQLTAGNGCSGESPECLMRVCRQLGVDALLSGRVARAEGVRTIQVSRFEAQTAMTAGTASATLPPGQASQDALQQRARELVSEAMDFKSAPHSRAQLPGSGEPASELLDARYQTPGPAGLDGRHITGYALLGGAVVSTGLSVLSWVQIDRAQANDSFAAYRRSAGTINANLRDVCDDAKSGQSHGLDATAFARVKSSCNMGKTFEVLQLVFLGGAVISGGLSAFLLFGGEAERPKNAAGHVTLHPSVSKRGASLGARMRF
jgi:hypothetical protein